MIEYKNGKLTDEELYDLYILQNKSSKEISDEYGINNKTLRDYLSRHNIRKTNGRGEWFSSIEEFYELYINQNKTIDELAEIYSVSRSCINHFICRRGILKDIESMTKNREKTMLEKYGVKNPMYSDEIKKKLQETCVEKYGAGNCLGNKKIREKALNTIKERYGVENASLNPEIKKKIYDTMHKNGTTPTSTQQLVLFNILKTYFNRQEIVLNKIFNRYSLDIELCTNDFKIDIEYDGWYWHRDAEKDQRRNKFLIENGYKVLRIKSGVKLPTEDQLLQGISFLQNSNKDYFEIILDDWKN